MGFGLETGDLPYMIAARGGLLRAIGLAVSFIAAIASKCRRGEAKNGCQETEDYRTDHTELWASSRSA